MSDKPTQRGRQWLARATPRQVTDALEAGELDDVLHGRDVAEEPVEQVEQLTRADLADMSSEQVVQAVHDGRLADVLAGKQPTP